MPWHSTASISSLLDVHLTSAVGNCPALLQRPDHPAQDGARRLFETETVFLPKTVLLEAEWVLHRIYRLGSFQVTKALRGLISLPNLQCEDEPAVRRALDLKHDGMDFADALHLASSGHTPRFATFDQRMITTAAKMGLPVSAP